MVYIGTDFFLKLKMLSWCYSINVWTNTQKLILHKDCPVFTIWGKLFFLPRVKTQEKLNSKWNNNFVSHKTESKLKTAFLNFLQRLSNILSLTGELIIINPIYCDSSNFLLLIFFLFVWFEGFVFVLVNDYVFTQCVKVHCVSVSERSKLAGWCPVTYWTFIGYRGLSLPDGWN